MRAHDRAEHAPFTGGLPFELDALPGGATGDLCREGRDPWDAGGRRCRGRRRSRDPDGHLVLCALPAHVQHGDEIVLRRVQGEGAQDRARCHVAAHQHGAVASGDDCLHRALRRRGLDRQRLARRRAEDVASHLVARQDAGHRRLGRARRKDDADGDEDAQGVVHGFDGAGDPEGIILGAGNDGFQVWRPKPLDDCTVGAGQGEAQAPRLPPRRRRSPCTARPRRSSRRACLRLPEGALSARRSWRRVGTRCARWERSTYCG